MNVDFLSKHRRSSIPIIQPKSRLSMVPYEPYRISTTENRYLEIRPNFPECTHAPLNIDISLLVCDGPFGKSITLDFGNTMMVRIRGHHLQGLFQELKRWKVEFIEAFDVELHHKPVDANAPYIEMIEIITKRIEPPPPMNQRH